MNKPTTLGLVRAVEYISEHNKFLVCEREKARPWSSGNNKRSSVFILLNIRAERREERLKVIYIHKHSLGINLKELINQQI